MGWLDNPYQRTVTDAEGLASPPNGGRVKRVVLGIALPLGLISYAIQIWLSGEAYWPGRGGSGMRVTGDAARAMSVGYTFLASFSHFRWFWGLVPHYLVFRVGTTISLLGFLGGLGASWYFLFR